MEIKQLFDPGKDIYRSIEKVIAYGVSQEERLKKEITEYVVTDSIDEQFNKLLQRHRTQVFTFSGTHGHLSALHFALPCN